ncbi:ComEC/Rec2 family competence protein [Agrococcus sp. SL85]|uniref:ComEC/Rec2 family competence protein n=1 Tax=Agrococcus sp. SL85 TaxID=2995141 RepID=UPI00226D21F0|nr:ComEC/Rec2 family competence protein [Agrococcus sp. SL85]WAC65702.1 ComEC/Rec2 family competence protein [Agrococcus sp. SL85]
MHDLRLAIPVGVAWAVLAVLTTTGHLGVGAIAAAPVAVVMLIGASWLPERAASGVRLGAVGVALSAALLAGAVGAAEAGLDACDQLTLVLLGEAPPAEVVVVGCDGAGAVRSAMLLRAPEAVDGAALAIGATAVGSCDAWLDGARWLLACDALEVGEPEAWAAWASPLRDGLLAASASLPGGGGELVPGLSIGDTRRLSPGLEAAMLETGLSHLTAVSGANCVIVVGAAFQGMAALGAPRWARVLVAAASLAGFALLVTPEPSVVRAGAMAAIALLGIATGRRTGALALLALAVLVVLAVQPHLATSPGFALSALATCGLVVHAAPIARALARWLPMPLAALIAVPTAAQLWCLPVLVVLDAQVSLVAVLANLLAGPAAPIATIAGLAVCLAAPLAPGVAAALAWIAWVPAAWIAGVAEASRTLPAAQAPWPAAPWGAVAAAAVLAAIVLGHARGRLLRGAAIATAIGVVASGTAALPGLRMGAVSDWRIAQCDVGQGSATLVREGGATVLVDVGPDPAPLAACLRMLGVARVDLLVLTHFDRDHVGGVDAVVGRVGAVVHGPLDERAAPVTEALAAGGATAAEADRGDAWHVGAIRVEALWPTGQDEPGNDASVAVALDLPGEGLELVVLGDLGAEAQARLLREGAPRARVVVAAHHGSADQLQALYGAIGASVGLVGVGPNDYGHPTGEALRILRDTGAEPLRTDERGTIALELSPEGVRVWSEREPSGPPGSGDVGGPP